MSYTAVFRRGNVGKDKTEECTKDDNMLLKKTVKKQILIAKICTGVGLQRTPIKKDDMNFKYLYVLG